MTTTTANHYILRTRVFGNLHSNLFHTGYAVTANTRDGFPIIRGRNGHSWKELYLVLSKVLPLSHADLIGPADYSRAA